MSREAGGPIRVAQVVNHLHYGGLERVVYDLVRHFPRGEVESHVVLLGYPGRYAADLSDHAALHLLPPMSKLSLVRPLAVTAVLRNIRPHVLHTHSGVWLKAARAGRAARIPAMIHTEHGRGMPDPLVNRVFDHLASRMADTVVAVSEPVAARLRAGIVSPRVPLVVIPNGIDTDRFRPRGGAESLRPEWGIPDGAPVIGSIGRLEPVKNYELMVHSLAALLRQWDGQGAPQPVLVLVGDGSDRQPLERLVSELGLVDQVRLLGWRDDVHRLLDTFDVFSLSSRSEGLSMSLLEAMASGLPCVVTDVGGNRALLGDDLADGLVPAGDAAALAHAWNRDLQSRERRLERGGLGRERVVRQFSTQHMVGRYLDLYHELLDGRDRHRSH